MQKSGLNLLNFRETSPTKYGTTLLNALFTEVEISTRCYEENSRTTKPVEGVILYLSCTDTQCMLNMKGLYIDPKEKEGM